MFPYILRIFFRTFYQVVNIVKITSEKYKIIQKEYSTTFLNSLVITLSNEVENKFRPSLFLLYMKTIENFGVHLNSLKYRIYIFYSKIINEGKKIMKKII